MYMRTPAYLSGRKISFSIPVSNSETWRASGARTGFSLASSSIGLYKPDLDIKASGVFRFYNKHKENKTNLFFICTLSIHLFTLSIFKLLNILFTQMLQDWQYAHQILYLLPKLFIQKWLWETKRWANLPTTCSIFQENDSLSSKCFTHLIKPYANSSWQAGVWIMEARSQEQTQGNTKT